MGGEWLTFAASFQTMALLGVVSAILMGLRRDASVCSVPEVWSAWCLAGEALRMVGGGDGARRLGWKLDALGCE